MQTPQWLQELRNVLAIGSYEGRQQALKTWERRWLIDLHARQLLSPDEITQARVGMLDRASEHVQYQLGIELGKIMVDVYDSPSAIHAFGNVQMIEVRGDVMAIRREPNEEHEQERIVNILNQALQDERMGL